MLQRLQQEHDVLSGVLLLQKLWTNWGETDRSYKEFSSHSLGEKPVYLTQEKAEFWGWWGRKVSLKSIKAAIKMCMIDLMPLSTWKCICCREENLEANPCWKQILLSFGSLCARKAELELLGKQRNIIKVFNLLSSPSYLYFSENFH